MKAAIVYAQRLGWRVLPVQPGGKKPILKDWTRVASNDPDMIAAWVEEFPTANIGIATGAEIWVLDIDPRHGGDEALASLEAEHGKLPRTPKASTPSGGSHYVFKGIPGLTNTASRVGKGIDTRGEGGQFVVAPSKTEQGAYRWEVAPWDCEPADAPEWLVELLTARTLAPAPVVDRGHFPPASPEVLDAAREALARHGPAVDGQGGGLHTVQAAAILTHDFALTPDEAWPLLVEWNDECEPPWDLEGSNSLREKLNNGLRYGKGQFGSKRTFDSTEAANKLIADWQTVGGEPAMFDMIKKVRALPFDDPSRKAVVEMRLSQATGLNAKQLGMPRLQLELEAPEQGEILVTTKMHEVANLATRAISPHVFQRVGVLCEVVHSAQRTFIYEIDQARAFDLMSEHAVFVRQDEKKGELVKQLPPAHASAMLVSRRTHRNVRELEAVTTSPVMLPDGSILSERGYNAQARLWLEPSVEVEIPKSPTLADAQAAVELFRDLLCDYKFHSDADFSVWLAALLSPLTKPATNNAPVPLMCFSASSPGAGKTKLAELISRIVTGEGAEIRPYNPRDASEWGKRLTSFVKMGAPVSVFDNVNGAFGDEALDRLITSTTWSDRLLGASDAPPLRVVTTWMLTGNNCEPIADTVRRVLMCRIEVDSERPQEREGFKRPELELYALEHRAEFLTAALTILRAFHLAGRPSQKLPTWGSFTTWSTLVRGAIVWAGVPDPFVTQKRIAAEASESDNDAHDFWLGVIGKTDGLPQSIADAGMGAGAREQLGLRDELTPLLVRKCLARFIDRPRSGKRIRRRDGRYFLESST